MTVRYLRKTKSGCPGSRGWFSLYRNPRLNKNFLTSSSGLVLLLFIADIQRWRCSLVSLSISLFTLFINDRGCISIYRIFNRRLRSDSTCWQPGRSKKTKRCPTNRYVICSQFIEHLSCILLSHVVALPCPAPEGGWGRGRLRGASCQSLVQAGT